MGAHYWYLSLYIQASPISLTPCATYHNISHGDPKENELWAETHRSAVPLGRFALVFLAALAIQEAKRELLLRVGVAETRSNAEVLLCTEHRALGPVRPAGNI